jgi:hypothetical protein
MDPNHAYEIHVARTRHAQHLKPSFMETGSPSGIADEMHDEMHGEKSG